MRKASAGMAVVIDDEPAFRRLLANILFDYGCAVATGADAADLERAIRGFRPDLLFLDISLRDANAFDLLEMVSGLPFDGAIQIVSGRSSEMLNSVFQAGGGLGLRMRTPLAKPFCADAVGRVLGEEGFLFVDETTGVPELGLVSRSWGCASAPVGLIDLVMAPAGQGRPTSQPLTPADQLIWWTARQDRYRESLLDLPAPAAFCIEARVADIPAMMPGLRRIEHSASRPAATIVLSEEDVFADLTTTRDMLCVLRLCGATIRLTGCGTRFFAIAGHEPLPIDQAVLGNPLSTADRVMNRLAELAHRAGTLLLADEIPGGRGADPYTYSCLDLWRDASRNWHRFGPDEQAAGRALPRSREFHSWRPVGLADAFSSRRLQ